MVETIISDFRGGMVENTRGNIGCQSLRHFDVYDDFLRPRPSFTSEGVTVAGYVPSRWTWGTYLGNSKLFAYCRDVGGVFPEVMLKDATVVGTASYTAVTNGVPTGGIFSPKGFIYFKNAVFGGYGGGGLFRYNASAATMDSLWSLTTNSLTLTALTAESVHMQNTDALYFFTSNKIYRTLLGTNDLTLVLTLPTDFVVTSACAYNTNYLAIGGYFSTSMTSKVFIWDQNSTFSTINDSIQWGDGLLLGLANLNGYLVGVSDEFVNSTLGNNLGRLVARSYAGSVSQVRNFIQTNTPSIGNVVFSDNNKLYIATVYEVAGGYQQGVLSVDEKGEFVIDLIKDTVNGSASGLNGIFRAGKVWLITDNTGESFSSFGSNYTYTSLYESRIFDGGKSSTTKRLKSVQCSFTSLTSGSITIKYKFPEEANTAWKTIVTTSTVGDNSIASNYDTNSKALPEYKEIQFRLESTGGSTIYDFRFKSEELKKDIYE